jgi:hypothetical protein
MDIGLEDGSWMEIIVNRVQWGALLIAELKRQILQSSKLIGLLEVIHDSGRKCSLPIYYPIPCSKSSFF